MNDKSMTTPIADEKLPEQTEGSLMFNQHPHAFAVTARALQWIEPSDDQMIGLHDDVIAYAVGLGGHYAVVPPQPFPKGRKPKPGTTIDINGVQHFRVLLWDAADIFSFTEHDSVEAAKLAAEADWQTNFRAMIASAPEPRL